MFDVVTRYRKLVAAVLTAAMVFAGVGAQAMHRPVPAGTVQAAPCHQHAAPADQAAPDSCMKRCELAATADSGMVANLALTTLHGCWFGDVVTQVSLRRDAISFHFAPRGPPAPRPPLEINRRLLI